MHPFNSEKDRKSKSLLEEESMELGSHIIAYCYLYRDQDESNKCMLSRDGLTIIKRNKRTDLPLASIRGLVIKKKKLLLPLVGGGILASLSFLALMSNRYNPWLTLSLLFVGVYMLYHGWLGSYGIQISTIQGNHAVDLRTVSNNVKAFTNFANDYLLNGDDALSRYQEK